MNARSLRPVACTARVSDADPAALAAELLDALREQSDALKSGDAVRLAAAESRRLHVLRQLAPGGARLPAFPG